MCRVILEGPDGVGKTTLGMKLADELGLGFYRRRTMHGIPHETLRALRLDDCVLDRSWMTDVVYSKVRGRTPGCSRTDVYRYGLIVARHCVMYLNMLPEIPKGSEFTSQLATLYDEYRRPHWSLPRCVVEVWQKPNDDEFKKLVERYKNFESGVDSFFPGQPEDWSTGGITPREVDLLISSPWSHISGGPTDAVLDILFMVGVKPSRVHVVRQGFEGHMDSVEKYLEPKVVMPYENLKREINGKTAAKVVETLRYSLNSAGIITDDLEPALRGGDR